LRFYSHPIQSACIKHPLRQVISTTPSTQSSCIKRPPRQVIGKIDEVDGTQDYMLKTVAQTVYYLHTEVEFNSQSVGDTVLSVLDEFGTTLAYNDNYPPQLSINARSQVTAEQARHLGCVDQDGRVRWGCADRCARRRRMSSPRTTSDTPAPSRARTTSGCPTRTSGRTCATRA
jgi:hypothetical protein